MSWRLIDAAIAEQEGLSLYLHFQPIKPVWQSTGDAVFFEALVRLKVGPSTMTAAHFLPGLAGYPAKMRTLDWWVLNKVAQRMWQDNHRYAVNVSAVTVDDPAFARIFMRIFKGLDTKGRLVLEVTEQNELSDRGVKHLRKVHDACCVTLDDFGAGYASPLFLMRLRPCGLKLEGEIVRNIIKDPWAMTIARSMMSLALELELMAIAEYVENAAIWGALRDIWEEMQELDLYVQGYGVR